MLAKERLLNGLHKLNETNALVDGMKDQLAKLAPVLEAKSKSTSELLAKVPLVCVCVCVCVWLCVILCVCCCMLVPW